MPEAAEFVHADASSADLPRPTNLLGTSAAGASCTGSRQNSITARRSIQGALGPLLRSRPGPYAPLGAGSGQKHTHLTKVLMDLSQMAPEQNGHRRALLLSSYAAIPNV